MLWACPFVKTSGRTSVPAFFNLAKKNRQIKKELHAVPHAKKNDITNLLFYFDKKIPANQPSSKKTKKLNEPQSIKYSAVNY